MTKTALDKVQETYLGLLIDSGQKLRYRTVLFGKHYAWMEDPATRHVYLERLPNDA